MKPQMGAAAALAVAIVLLAGCGSTSRGYAPSSGPSVLLTGVTNGVLDLAIGASDTIQASEPDYTGTYVFTIADASVATLSIPAGASSVHRDATSTVTVTQGKATITAVGSGSTTLTVQTANATATVSLVVSSTSASPSSSPTGSATATPTPTAPPPGVLSANPTTLSFYSTGASAAQTVLVQQTNFSGTLSESDTCSGIVSISPTSSTSPYGATVTPVAAGTCTITFSDGTQTVPVAVTVTTAGVTVNTKGRVHE
ncbi:MAG TPA: hypothetical protein VMG98_09150 [Verrucomicrobiae bacterium]|nr:hypothetical protein [Verrucomicrobiae bacterium]